ncbi:hypothetical protein F383_11018 [Gossypium arboreum]|uniref:Uncharacterized protein n=1 Tax=Gossypium arboreum TaxID=29729 RepID=A0A0B0NGQ8_GOSAR|nr:hypothetical protein F383_11018 [Gossypium arboreum]
MSLGLPFWSSSCICYELTSSYELTDISTQ